MHLLKIGFSLVVSTLIIGGCASTRDAPAEMEKPIQEVVEHPHPKVTAFNNAKRWAAQNFNSADDVIQEEDEETGTLIFKGIEPVKQVSGGPLTPTYDVSYTLTLDVRDEKMRLTFDPGQHIESGRLSEGMAEGLRNHYKEQLRPDLLKSVRQRSSF